MYKQSRYNNSSYPNNPISWLKNNMRYYHVNFNIVEYQYMKFLQYKLNFTRQ